MSDRETRPASPFAIAAVALDRELDRFRQLTESVSRIPLSSRRNLERAARTAEEAAQCQSRLGLLMQEFIGALQAVRVDNENSATVLAEKRVALEQRSLEVSGLLQRFAQISEVASAISNAAQSIFQTVRATGADAEGLAAIAGIEEQMDRVVEEARLLGNATRDAGVDDLIGEIDSLRQQLQSVKNRIHLLRQRLSDGSGPPPASA